MDGDYKQPNGIIGTPDGKTLYVADIGDRQDVPVRHREGRHAEEPQGVLRHGLRRHDDRRRRERLPHAAGRRRSYDKSGKKVATIDVPEGTTNVCFGGKDMKTLFITAGTSLYSIPMKVKGAARQ